MLFVFCIALSTTHECNKIKAVQERDIYLISMKSKSQNIGISNIGQHLILCIPIPVIFNSHICK